MTSVRGLNGIQRMFYEQRDCYICRSAIRKGKGHKVSGSLAQNMIRESYASEFARYKKWAAQGNPMGDVMAKLTDTNLFGILLEGEYLFCSDCFADYEHRHDNQYYILADEAIAMIKAETPSGEAFLNNSVELLVTLYKTTQNCEGFVSGSRAAEPVIKVGKMLGESGGFKLMAEAHTRFAGILPQSARNLEMVWNGVGEWQG